MAKKPEEKNEVVRIEEPVYGGDVISSVKKLLPGLVEEHHSKLEELRAKRDGEIESLDRDERYSSEFIKAETSRIKAEYNDLIRKEESAHRSDIHNRIAESASEEQGIIYADDEEEASYRTLVNEAKNSIRDAVLTDDKISRKLALETAVNLRKIAQIEEQRELTKLIRHYPLEALEQYKSALSENKTRIINYFESVWPTVKAKTNPLAVGDLEKDSASMQTIEESFEKLRSTRLKNLKDKLGPVSTQKNALQMYLNDLELAESMRR